MPEPRYGFTVQDFRVSGFIGLYYYSRPTKFGLGSTATLAGGALNLKFGGV